MSEAQHTRDTELSKKVRSIFGDLATDKQRLPSSRIQSHGIPSYVGEWLLDSVVPGTGPLTLAEGQRIREFAAKRIPRAEDEKSIRFRLQQGETVRVLTPVEVDVVLKRGKQDRVAKMKLIGIDDAYIAPELVERHEDLLRHGMWGQCELVSSDEGPALVSFKPMQATVDLDLYKQARGEFTRDEWRALMVMSMGYRPSALTEDQQLLVLCRALPLVQKHMHLIELAPKGTGKSYFYENVSPRVRLVSGGNVSPAVLFVNNATGQWGLLARFKVVVLDEVQKLKFEKPEEIVGGLKGFLANARLTRGGLNEAASDCGLVLLANIALDDQQRPMRYPIVQELPPFLQDTAFLDRIKGIIPGWELPKLGSKSFADGTGLKSDFFGDVLVALRDDLEPDQFCSRRIVLAGEGGIRNDLAVRSIASGMMKLLFPHGDVTDEELQRFCVRPALRLRQLVWDQLYALDAEYRQYDRDLRASIRPNQSRG